MRAPGSPTSTSAASVIVVGVDNRAMGQIRETLGAEAVVPATSTSFDDALGVIEKSRPDAIIVGFDQDFDDAIRVAQQVSAQFARTQMVALSHRADPDRIRAAMRAGYREYVVLPEDGDLLRQAIHEASFREGPDEDNGEVIALWGSKGGVGTTFLAVNLGAELSPVQRVCVVDLDFSMGDAAAMLDMQPAQTMLDLLRNVHRLDERMLAGSVAVHASKLHVLAQPTDLEQREEVRGDMVMKVLTAVARSYQYVIVDCGSRLDEATLTAATVADRLLLIATPDVPAIRNTWRRLQLIERLGIERDRVHLVVNRIDRKTPELTLSEIETNLNRKVDASVGEDRAVVRAVNHGKLLREVDRKSPVLKDLETTIGLVTDGEIAAPAKTDGFMSRLFKF
jgi:pilus assembly protein CpaE